MCFPSRQAQPFWFWGYSHFSEVFHPQHHGKPDLMVQPFWITKSTVCVNLLHCPGWVSLIPPPSDALPKPLHHQEPQNAIFHTFLREGTGMSAQWGKKFLQQHRNPSLKQCKSSFSLYGSPLIFYTSADSGQGWTDLRKGLGVLWKSLRVQSCVCI